MDKQRAQRKNEHLSLAEKFYQECHQADPFAGVKILPNALPEMSLDEAQPATKLAGLPIKWPFYLEAITGGSKQADQVNQQLAQQAANRHLAMATGSMAVIFNDQQAADGFAKLRDLNPDGVMIANLGAHVNVQQAKTAVQLIDADALEIHLNVTQELIMPEGSRDFKWADNIARIIDALDVPVIIKEVGFGMTKETIDQLVKLGARWVNVSGHGGTSFATIENRRNHRYDFSDLNDWGLSTVASLLEARDRHINVVASGGITTPLQVIKAGCLGAQAVGVAGFFLHQLMSGGSENLDKTISSWQAELPRIMTMLGIRRFPDLTSRPVVFSPALINYVQQRHLNV